MDLGTLIGLVVTTILIALAVGSSVLIFIDIPSIQIVVGGVIGVTLIKFRLNEILSTFKLAINAVFFDKSESPHELIELATSLTKIVQKEGVIALEGQEIKNPFFQKGINLVMDGHSPEFTEKVLRNELSKAIETSDNGAVLLESLGDAAPGMGMLGTLIGLILMLKDLSDIASLGPNMAIALITTLYGSLIQQVISVPLATKLRSRSKELKDMYELIIQSVLSIQQGQSAIIMTQLLETYLKSGPPPAKKA